MDQVTSFDFSDMGSSSDSSDTQVGHAVHGEAIITAEASVDKYGMNDEQFISYVNYRDQTLEFCEDYLALYTSNPEYQLDF